MTSFKLPLRILLTGCLAFGTRILAQHADRMVLSADHPGLLASWMQSRPIYSSNGAAIPATHRIGARPIGRRWRASMIC